VIAIIGILVGLLLPAVQSAREAARRMSCQNNMHQIGVALHNYNGAFNRFPPGSRLSNFMGPLTAILPFLEQDNTFKQFDFTLSYADPYNQAVASQTIPVYLCPAMNLNREVPDPSGGEVGGPSSYLACEGTGSYMPQNDGMFGLNWQPFGFNNPGIKFRDFTDGVSNTIAFGETTYDMEDYLWGSRSPRVGEVKWGTSRWVVGYPAVSLGTTLLEFNVHTAANNGGFQSMHSSGANFVYADGSVRFMSDGQSRDVLNALATRNGSEIIGDEQR
jgi:prepilin-type processing-associated H-X9-DG protein